MKDEVNALQPPYLKYKYLAVKAAKIVLKIWCILLSVNKENCPAQFLKKDALREFNATRKGCRMTSR